MDPEARVAFEDALRAGDRAHLLTVGSPERFAVRVTLGRLDREGRWHGWQPDVFACMHGCRYGFGELAGRAREDLNRRVAARLPRRLALAATIRVGVHATTGEYSDTEVPAIPFTRVLERWPV